MASVEDDGKLQCQFCSRAFKRSGHLRRHERIHSSSRPFRCGVCLRAFSRRDALRRHETSHVDAPNLLQLGARACIYCAAAKTRCSGTVPCERCQARSFACVYPPDASPAEQGENQSSPSGHASAPDPLASNLQPKDASTTNTSGPYTTTSNLMPQEGFINLNAAPNVLTGSSMLRQGVYPPHEWDDDLMFVTNWLEEPVAPDLNLSPLSWAFPQPRPQVNESLPDPTETSPSQGDTYGQIGPAVLDHPSTGTYSDGQASSEAGRADMRSARGEFYVDGESARLPRGRAKRRRLTSREGSVLAPWSGTYSLYLDEQAFPQNAHGSDLSENNYRMIVDMYQRLCSANEHFRAPFTDHPMPSQSLLGLLLSNFFERFSVALPFVHWTVRLKSDRHWLFDLALISIGSQYLGNPAFSASLHELVRRCLLMTTELDGASIEQDSLMIAALLLNTIGLAYSGDPRLQRHALRSHSQLKLCFDSLKARLKSAPTNVGPGFSSQQWYAWVQQESEVRLAFSIWLIDTMFACHKESAPTFQLQSVDFALPCSDGLWQARSIEEWVGLHQQDQTRSTLVDALRDLHYNKAFDKHNHEFVRILVIHGLFHRLWEVEKYFSGALSHWEPSSTKQPESAPCPQQPPWLPAVPAFRNWQSSSCDAIDVLHWQANGTIGHMRGLEHPTVMHLHFARTVLLSPCGDLLVLARGLGMPHLAENSRERTEKSMDMVRRWALHHQYKARLAVIHAGVILWHIRRHGIDAFYEPASTALSILALWAFSSFADRKATKPSASGTGMPPPNNSASQTAVGPSTATAGDREEREESDESSSESSNIILLDRPTDDELVQQFIRYGATMRPHVGSVGEIFAPGAPPLILEHGVKLLSSQECWGDARRWAQLLQHLSKACRFDMASGSHG